MTAPPANPIVTTSLSGFVLVLIQFDVCEELRLEVLQQAVSARTVQKPSIKQPAPAYVRYKRPPVVGPLEPLQLETGERLEGEIKYYDYGVVSVIYQLPFSGDWDSLVRLASRWVWDVDFALRVEPVVRQRLERVPAAMVKPYNRWLSEDYFIFHVREATGSPSAVELVRDRGRRSRRLFAATGLRLSEGEVTEVLHSQISYYANDLAVIGWNAAFLYDSSAGAETAIQLLEYANSQLLEFRHYRRTADRHSRQRLRHPWPEAEPAGAVADGSLRQQPHTVLLEVSELTEHADNAIKFLSDMFAARLYRLAAGKVGVPDYRDLVEQKLKTAEDLYDYMVEQHNQNRGVLAGVHGGADPADRAVLLLSRQAGVDAGISGQ